MILILSTVNNGKHMDDSKALILAIGVAYLWIALRQYMKDDPWVALMFAGYAVSQWAIYHQAK